MRGAVLPWQPGESVTTATSPDPVDVLDGVADLLTKRLLITLQLLTQTDRRAHTWSKRVPQVTGRVSLSACETYLDDLKGEALVEDPVDLGSS